MSLWFEKEFLSSYNCKYTEEFASFSDNHVNTFNNRLENQELIYDYQSTLTGTGNRSFADNVDDTIF